MPDLPNFQKWPGDAKGLETAKLIEMYERGFAGAYDDPAAKEKFRASVIAAGGYSDGGAAAAAFGWNAAKAEGQLTIPFTLVEKTWPGCWPGPAQGGPDCVSLSTRNAVLGSWTVEIVMAAPDEVTGVIEGMPEISPEGISNGVLSTEVYYAERGHGGGGADCGTLAEAATKSAGIVPRANYPEAGVDFTRYIYSWGAGKGGRGLPEAVAKIGKQHLVRTATELDGAEQIRDFLANGYFPSSCGSEGFSSTRNEDGVSKRSGSWSHAMAYIGFDDRAETKQKYSGPLVLVLNSWGVFNTGPRRIPGTEIDIPEGSFWARWADVSRRYVVAFSSANGWPARDLPNWGATGRI